MQEIRKSVIKFNSSNDKDTITGYFYENQEITKAKAIIQISHGMSEYIARYSDFATFMVRNGYVVCGNDHLGHGQSSDTDVGIDGYFSKSDAKAHILNDLHKMNEIAKGKFPNVPIILLGHSMGSFFARIYAAKFPTTINGLIISGTAGANPISGLGSALANVIMAFKGDKHRSNLLNDIAFGSYTKKIPNAKTQYDWLSKDENIVDIYSKDPKCTTIFTVNGFITLMQALNESNKNETIQNTPKNMPVYIFSGDMDPVGNYSAGVKQVYNQFKLYKINDVTLKLYKDGRHEMINEIEKEVVYNDILKWCDGHCALT